jgi:hypothetical protein
MSEDNLTEAVNDLTRVMLVLHGNGASKSEMIRRLHAVAIPPVRIASLLSIPTKDVTSAILKLRKAKKGRRATQKHG